MNKMNFSERAIFAMSYYEWLKEEDAKLNSAHIKDCPESVMVFYQNVWTENNTLIWKEVEYDCERKCTVIGHGFYKGREWIILNLGSHPTAYVKLTDVESEKLDGLDYFDDIDVHGGCTWLDTFVPIKSSEDFQNVDDGCKWFGWDYAHGGDYDAMIARSRESLGYFENGKQYTTRDIYEDIKSVVEQLNELNWNDFGGNEDGNKN